MKVKKNGIDRNILQFLFFVSGACGLIYEILWLRYFTTAFGVTIYATSVVLAAFMGGLALGSYLFGRFAEYKGSPLRIYAGLEVCIGLYALMMPHLLDALPFLYKAVYVHWSDNLTLTLGARFVMSFAVLLIPTTMMGATLPVLSKFFVTESERVGKEGGRLYAFNTFGAVAGTIATGFILIPAIGISTTNLTAASLNLLVGAVALFLDKQTGPVTLGEPLPEDPKEERQYKKRKTMARETLGSGVAAPRWVLVGIGLSGFAALSYEIIWTRVISIITFNTVFAFTAMLAAFLVGIALGSYVFSKVIEGKNLWSWFGKVQLGIGLYAFLSPFLFGHFADYFYHYQAVVSSADSSWGGFVLKQFLLASFIMLIPTVLMGGSFPLACKLYATGTGKKAAGVGDVYASNTLGAIAGSVFTGLLLIPEIGLKGSLATAAALNIIAGAGGIYVGRRRRKISWSSAGGMALVAAGMFMLFINMDVTFRDRINTNGKEIIFQVEDATGLVEVWQSDGHRFMVTNRLHTEGSSIPAEIYKMRKQGYLPLFLHPEPKSVIEIGLGTGIGFTPVIYEKVRSAEMIEISPGVVKAAAFFADENQSVLDNAKVRLKIEDGRNYLLLTEENYDVIVLGLFTPYRSGVGYLYTKEFYLQCREKLKRGGMLFQWVAIGQLPPQSLRIVLNTFRSVFPHVYVWEKGYYLGLMGTTESLSVDFKRFKSAFGHKSIREDIRKWELDDPYNFIASYLMGSEEVAQLGRGFPLNTNDTVHIEFSNTSVSKAAYSLEYAAANLEALLKYRKPFVSHLKNVEDTELQDLQRYFKGREYSLKGLVYEAKGLYRAAYENFQRGEAINKRDDLARFSLKKYRQALN